MKVSELEDEIEKDSKIDPLNLESEILSTTKLIAKYLRIYKTYKYNVSTATKTLNQLYVHRMRYYKGECNSYKEEPFNYIIKNAKELERYLSADLEISETVDKLSKLETATEIIKEFLDTLKFRNNHLNYIIKLRMFEAGE